MSPAARYALHQKAAHKCIAVTAALAGCSWEAFVVHQLQAVSNALGCMAVYIACCKSDCVASSSYNLVLLT
jgi:hypothetical protein